MADNNDGALFDNIASKFSGGDVNDPNLQDANIQNEILINRIIRIGNMTRANVVSAIKDELQVKKIVFNRTNLEHIQFITEYLVNLLFQLIEIVNEEPGNGNVFKIDTIDMQKFLGADMALELPVINGRLPSEVIKLLGRIS